MLEPFNGMGCVAATDDGRIITCSALGREEGEAAKHSVRKSSAPELWQIHDTSSPTPKYEYKETLKAHENWVKGVVVLPPTSTEPSSFISYGGGTAVILWSIDDNRQLRRFEVGRGVRCVAALHDGTQHFVVGVCSYEVPEWGEFRIYNGESAVEQPLYTINGHTGEMEVVAVMQQPMFAGEWPHIISASTDGLVTLWSVTRQKPVRVCRGHTGRILAVVATPDGRRFLSGGMDKTVCVWLLNARLDGTLESKLENTFSNLHTTSVTALVALPGNQHALSGSVDRANKGGTIKLFEIGNGAVLRDFTHHTSSAPSLALLSTHPRLRFVSFSHDDPTRTALPRSYPLHHNYDPSPLPQPPAEPVLAWGDLVTAMVDLL